MNQSCCLIWLLTPGVELNNHEQNIQEKQIYEQLKNKQSEVLCLSFTLQKLNEP